MGVIESLLYVFAVLLLLKFVINFSKYVRTKQHLSRYKKWLSDPNWSLVESRAQVIRLLKDAGVEDVEIGVTQPIGFNQVQVANVSVMRNFPNKGRDFAAHTHRLFSQAIGTYRSRMFETFNPLYWIEAIINLPRELLAYLGIPPESVFVKLLQVMWWVFGTVFAVIYLAYRPEIISTVRDWLSNLTQ